MFDDTISATTPDPDPARAPHPTSRPWTCARTVLMIEDSEIIRRVLSLILEPEGYRVVESADGATACELARDLQPDVITLDLSLPGVDGRDLLRSLHDDPMTRNVPRVVISAFADSLTSAERRLAQDVIVKPFDLDDLITRLDRAVQARTCESGTSRRERC